MITRIKVLAKEMAFKPERAKDIENSGRVKGKIEIGIEGKT